MKGIGVGIGLTQALHALPTKITSVERSRPTMLLSAHLSYDRD
jgi:hypothetical protein